MLVRYQLKSLCSDREFEKTVNLLDSIEPNNTNSAFYRALFKLVKWKAKAKEVLDELIEYRETHQTDMAEMLHSEGFHLDSMIAIYLMECGYYKQAKKLFDFLLSKNYENDFINHYLSLLNGKKDT